MTYYRAVWPGWRAAIAQNRASGHLAPMRSLAALAGLCLAQSLAAQAPGPRTAPSTASFIPEGYRTLREVAGHLNGDEHRDVVLILGDARETPDSILEEALPRLLLVLAGTRDGYRLDVRTDNAVLGRMDGGAFDPLDDLSLDRNVIVLGHYGGSAWRWRFVHRFRIQAGEYRLVGRTTTSYFNAAYCEKIQAYRPTTVIDDNLITGQRIRTEVPEHRCIKRTRRTRFKAEPITLGGFDIRKDVEER